MGLSLAINFMIIAFLILGAYAGWRKGLIKTAVQFIGLVAIVIISYALRYPLVEFMIDYLPFFNFAGFEGLTALTILIYNVIAFIVIFILLYCLLSIVMTLTNFIDTLLKFTIIWVIPSKIGGAILGFLEAWVFLFLVVFVAGSFNLSAEYIHESKAANVLIERTPLIGKYLSGVTNGAKNIYNDIKELKEDETKTTEEINLHILQLEISNGLITKEKAQELVDTDKISVGDVLFGLKGDKWLNI